MASAVREAIRTRARMESENVCDQHLEAGGRTASLAFRRLHPAKVAQRPADWLAGFNAWFIEGAAQRLQRLARIRVSPSFALPLWWQS
jgi:hypothetical protein